MSNQKTIAFFPEGAFGPALNSVGIAQASRDRGHRCVFLTDPGFAGVFEGYGFEERIINLSEPMSAEEMAKYWSNFIDGHIPNFNKTPLEQIDNYVKECWEAIVDTAKWAEKDLPDVLDKLQPDLICIDNVILFPATKQFGVPWIRIISCSENAIEDSNIPPHLSGCGENDHACFDAYRMRFQQVIKPVHDDFNKFLESCNEAPYPDGVFFEPSPYMNLLLYPKQLQYVRSNSLDPARYQYLEGCVRSEEPYEVPAFAIKNDKPLVYFSFGSLGSGDTDLIKRILSVLGDLDYRVLANVGDYQDAYTSVPDNVHICSWYPQPSVIEQADVVIHHGGNNSFTECLYFGKPALIMPYVWDGHDNATRVQETKHGLKMHRSDWSDAELALALDRLLVDVEMKERLKRTSAHMKAENGREKAAQIIDELLRCP